MPTILLSTLDLQIEFPNQPYKTTCLIVRTQMMNPIKQEAQMTVPDKQSKVDDHSDHEHGDDEEESEEESEDEDSEDEEERQKRLDAARQAAKEKAEQKRCLTRRKLGSDQSHFEDTAWF